VIGMGNQNRRTHDRGDVVTRIAKLLDERPSSVDVLKAGQRATVYRCHLRRGGSVIAKEYASDTKEARREREALVFLAGRHWHTMAPRLLAKSTEGNLVIVEDLNGELLSSILERGSEQSVRECLVAFACELADFHGRAATQMDSMSASLRSVYREEAQECGSILAKLVSLFVQAGIERATGFDAAWTRMFEGLGTPHRLLTLTHGDLAPSNILLTDSGARLLDFEYAGERSGLYDVMFWEAVVPFPRQLAQPMTDAYRATLGAHVPEAADDELFQCHLAVLKTHRLFWWLTFRLKDALTAAEREWVPGWPLRRAYLFYLQNHLSTVQQRPELEPMYRTAEALHARLSAAWNERADYPSGFLPNGSE
jgi:Ser/Thr protein kinase RdoA (MazF antagonist)